MKRFIASLFLLIGLVSISQAGPLAPTRVYQVGISSITTFIINVSTSAAGVGFGATKMDNPTMAERVSIEIQNIDASANLWCLPISTQPIASGGRKITAGSSWIVSFLDKVLGAAANSNFWCLSDGAAATKAAVTQVK